MALTGAPGAGRSYVLTTRKNGVSMGVIATISNLDTDGSDLSNSFTVAAGDRICLMSTPTGTPAAQQANYSLKFVADTDGESLIGGNAAGADLDNVAVRYTSLLSSVVLRPAEYQAYHISSEFTYKNLYVLLDGAPGAGASYRARFKIDFVNKALTALIAGADVSGNDTVNEILVTDGEKASLSWTPLVGPTPSSPRWGLTAFFPPVTTWAPTVTTNPATAIRS